MRFLPLFAFSLFLCLLLIPPAYAEQDPFKSSGLPVPRFVSLKSDEVRLRTGPATRYPVRWVYQKKGLPVEVIQEFEHWRKIRDPDGEEGWVHGSLLSGKRMVLVKGNDAVLVHERDDMSSSVVAKLEPGVVVSVEDCKQEACLLSFSGFEGWVQRKFIWGIYADEKFN